MIGGTHVILGVFCFHSFERLVSRVEGGTYQPDGVIEGPRHVEFLFSLSEAEDSPPSEFDYLTGHSGVY